MTQGAHRARLVLTVGGERWIKDADLPIAPFPGLGLRVDTYDVLNVVAVTVGADGVECAVAEDEPAGGLTERHCLSFGFRREPEWESELESELESAAEPEPEASRPPMPDDRPIPAALVVVDAELGTWQRALTLPFPPFAGLGIRLGSGVEASVFSIVVGDRHGPLTCLATLGDGHGLSSEQDFEAHGFEESLYP